MPGLDTYEARAVALATNVGELEVLRDKLAANRKTAALFDTPRFVRDLESAYSEMWRIYWSGETLREIAV